MVVKTMALAWSHGVQEDSALRGMAVVATCFLEAVDAVVGGDAVVSVLVNRVKNYYNGARKKDT
jgi:hypothetical protein